MININSQLDSKLKTTKRIKKKQGFTLVELIVVVAIIAILAASLTPSFSGYISEAKKVAVINQAKNIVTAFEAEQAKSSAFTMSTSASEFASKSTLLNSENNKTDVSKLGPATIEDCYKIIDTEKNKITLKDGIFESVELINSSNDSNTEIAGDGDAQD